MAVISQTISPLTAIVLASSVDPTNPTEVTAFVNAWETFNSTLKDTTVDELNTFGSQINAVRNEVNTLRNETASDASDAADSANTASSLANNKGAWSALTGTLNIPASVNHNNYVWILNTDLADVTASEPSDVNTDWTKATISPEDYYTSDETDDLLDQKADISLLSSDISLYPTTASGDFTYNKLVTSTEDADYDDTAQDVSTGSISGADQLVGGLIAEANLFSGNPGQINITTIGNIKRVSGGTDTYATFYFKLFKRDSGGTETLVATSSTTDAVASATYVQFYTSALLDNGDFEETDRLVLKFYATKVGSDTDPIYNFQYGGVNPVRTLLPIPVNISLGNYYTKTEQDSREFSYKANNVLMGCINASPLLSETEWTPDKINASSSFDIAGNEGVVLDGGVGGYYDVVMPYMVVIGDSIAEGSPALYSRLHPDDLDEYDPSYLSESGQISYELALKYNIPVLNQGIGGDTTVDVRNRWNRDVLALSDDIGDGRGAITLEFDGQKPFAVYLHVGVNDIDQDVPIETIKNNYRFFAQSCRDNNIKLILANIGSYSTITAPKTAVAESVNEWLSGDFKRDFKEVELVDYLNWSTGGTNVFGDLRNERFADFIHPDKDGYVDYSEYIIQSIKAPLKIKNIEILTNIVDETYLQRMTEFTMDGISYRLEDKTYDSFVPNLLSNRDDPVYRITVDEVANVPTALYTGIARIVAHMESGTYWDDADPEIGTFTDGTYIKRKNGELEYRYLSSSALTTNLSQGAIFYKISSVVSLPIPFVGDLPSVIPIAQSGSATWASVYSVALDGIQITLIGATNTNTGKVGFVAKGYWK